MPIPKPSTIRNTSFVLAALIAFGIRGTAQAASVDWTGSMDNDWQKTANWGGAASIPGSGEIATFKGAGNGQTTLTNIPSTTLAQIIFESASVAAYTLAAGSATWSVPNGGGVTVTNTVTTNQWVNFQFLRPAVNATVNFSNQGNGWLKLGTLFLQNAGTGTTQTRMNFTPARKASIEVTGLIDNAGSNTKKLSILLNGLGTLKISGNGFYDGTDADGNSVTLRQGTLMASSITNASPTYSTRSSLGANGRIQFGESGQSRAATLDYYSAANANTDRTFHIIDNNSAVFRISGGSSTNLTLSAAITQSSASFGGGRLHKDGMGSLTLAVANNHTGTTSLNLGSLVLKNANALQHTRRERRWGRDAGF